MSDLNFATQAGVRPRAANASAVGFPWRILIITLVIFGLSVVIYVGINFGYIPYLNSQLEKVDVQFAQLSKSFDENQQKEFINFYSQLYNIKNLSSAHVYPSKVFDLIETSLYRNVRLSNLQMNVASEEIRIDGIAQDFDTLANQLASLKSNPDIYSVSLDSSKKIEVKDGGGVSFSAKLVMKKGFFNSK